MKAVPFYIIFIIPVVFVTGTLSGGIFTFSVVIALFALTPILDLLTGTNKRNPDSDEEMDIKDSFRFRVIPILCVPLQMGIVAWALFVFTDRSLTTTEAIGFIVSAGISSGILGINIAHELSHRLDNNIEPFLSRLLLLTVGYMHWGIEHVYGHHKTVGTPQDPATARLGESILRFLPRTIIGGFLSAWKIESDRLSRTGISKWNYKNRILRYLTLEILLIVFISIVFGTKGTVFFISQASVAVILLEMVNYMEHYGLARKEIARNQYEPVSPVHSWNSNNLITNTLLFNLQRHSDHHYAPLHRYQILRHFDGSSQLPTGYTGMILIVLTPFLWRFIMDKKVIEWRRHIDLPKGLRINNFYTPLRFNDYSTSQDTADRSGFY